MTPASPVFLMRRLIELAGQERDLLVAGSWEQALPVREQFDEHFAQLQAAAAHAPLPASLRNDLIRLHQLQGENMQLSEQLKATAGKELGEIAKVRQLNGYAPLGPGHKPVPRYLDESA